VFPIPSRCLRSPSPEPIYSGDGKRLNTREYRKRKQLEEERHEAVQKMILLNPEYKPPSDYRFYCIFRFLFSRYIWKAGGYRSECILAICVVDPDP
jgi:hypothetical protein